MTFWGSKMGKCLNILNSKHLGDFVHFGPSVPWYLKHNFPPNPGLNSVVQHQTLSTAPSSHAFCLLLFVAFNVFIHHTHYLTLSPMHCIIKTLLFVAFNVFIHHTHYLTLSPMHCIIKTHREKAWNGEVAPSGDGIFSLWEFTGVWGLWELS